jgi:hypothetical protein
MNLIALLIDCAEQIVRAILVRPLAVAALAGIRCCAIQSIVACCAVKLENI